jgi:sulfur-oxidizing protein SoxX
MTIPHPHHRPDRTAAPCWAAPAALAPRAGRPGRGHDKAAFRDQGIAKVDRIQQDLGQKACSSDQPPPTRGQADRGRVAGHVKWPAGGQYLGDWREGEKLAQNGRGMTWTDSLRRHQGQRRPVLQLPPDRQGRDQLRHHRPQPVQLRQDPRRDRPGYARPAPPSCSTPGASCGTARPTRPAPTCRASATWAADENQLRHVMALLLDPKSPVNQ